MDRSCLIAGCGYTGLARRAAAAIRRPGGALARSDAAAAALAAEGIVAVRADLDGTLPACFAGGRAAAGAGGGDALLVRPPRPARAIRAWSVFLPRSTAPARRHCST